MTAEIPMFPEPEIASLKVEYLDPPVQDAVNKCREYIGFPEFSAPKSSAFRDFVDFVNISAIQKGLINSEPQSDPNLDYALISERLNSRFNDNQEYAYALFSYVSFLENIIPNQKFGPKVALTALSALKKLNEELFYPKLKEIMPEEPHR